jgi:hypothetical protein
MSKLDDMLKAAGPSNVTEMKGNNTLNEAEAKEQAGVRADAEAGIPSDDEKQKMLDDARVATLKEGEERRAAKVEEDKKKFEKEHFDTATLKKQQDELKKAHAPEPEVAPSDYIFEVNHGRHRLKIVSQSGMNYRYYAECSCAWQGRFMTQELAESTAKDHVFGRKSSAA